MRHLMAPWCMVAGLLAATPVCAQSEPYISCSWVREYPKNRPPVVSIRAPNSASLSSGEPFALHLEAADPDGDKLYVTWGVEAGRISADPPDFRDAVWTLTGIAPGVYTLTLEVNDAHGCLVMAKRQLEVRP